MDAPDPIARVDAEIAATEALLRDLRTTRATLARLCGSAPAAEVPAPAPPAPAAPVGKSPAPAERAGRPGPAPGTRDAAQTARRLAIARELAPAPLGMFAVCERLAIPKGSFGKLVRGHPWFAKTATGKHDPWTLTPEGRAALDAAGFPGRSSAATAPSSG